MAQIKAGEPRLQASRLHLFGAPPYTGRGAAEDWIVSAATVDEIEILARQSLKGRFMGYPEIDFECVRFDDSAAVSVRRWLHRTYGFPGHPKGLTFRSTGGDG